MSNMREAYAATSHANLQWSEISERPIDRVAAAGLCDPLGVMLWRIKYQNEDKWKFNAANLTALKMVRKYPSEPELICFKVAEQAIREYSKTNCKKCSGVKEVIGKYRRITCDVCSGSGIRRWTDFERARGTGLAIGRVKTLERKFSWTVNLLLTLDAEVNRQIEFYLGRNE